MGGKDHTKTFKKKGDKKDSTKHSFKEVFPNVGSINGLEKRDIKWSEGAFNRSISDNVTIARKINWLSFIYGMSILGWT